MTSISHRGIRTWIEIDKKALANNYIIFRKLIPKKSKLMAVAKSNAYGHGLIDYSKEMERLGADFIGVDSMTEAIALRRKKIKIPILVLGYTLPELYVDAAKNDISITISSKEQLENVDCFLSYQDSGSQTTVQNDSKKLKIHIKVDTGMHRQGFYLENLKDIKAIKTFEQVEIEGLYTHFASAKNPDFTVDTVKQITEFKTACKILEAADIHPVRHAVATGGAIVFPEAHFDMVRIGIGLMGLWPSKEAKNNFQDKIMLRSALSWRSIVSEIKRIKKGERIGYDFTETFFVDSTIAIIPIGYWHGLRRNLSSVGEVLINGCRAKILGRISMDMIAVDITKVKNVKVGSVTTVIGKDGTKEVTAEEMASLSDTSWYETITSLNPLIKRIYL